MTEARVGRATFALGLAGLLPQAAAVAMVLSGTDYQLGEALAFGYGSLILSFIGGIWWGFAMRRAAGQAALAAVAVLPSLVAFAIGIGQVVRGTLDQALVALGLAIVLTLIVDYRLSRTGEVPEHWMRLRVILSVGLGTLTILAGAV